MTRRNIDITMQDTLQFYVTVENAGSPIDITGYQFRMTAKYAITDLDANAVFSITSPGSIALSDPTNGVILVTISPANTNSLEIGQTYRLVYDIQMYNDPGTTYTICSGFLNVFPDVSRTTP